MATVIIPVACDEHAVSALVNEFGVVDALYCADCDQEFPAENNPADRDPYYMDDMYAYAHQEYPW